MKRIKRASIVLIAVALVVSLTMVLPASAQREKEDVEVLSSEFVLATMDYSGSIDEVQVFNWLSLNGNGTVTVKEEAAFDDIGSYQAVKGFAKPSVEGDYIVWPEISVDGPANVIANTVLGESSVEEARMRIPLGVRFKYWFEGEPVTDLETITGKSGRFKMELTLRNESKEMTEIEYKDPATGQMVTERVETYLPMVILPYDWYFDNSIFFNLEADPTGLVVWMPDFYNVGWSIPLFPPATEESHTIWVAADVKDFAMPPLTLAVAFHFPETNQTNITATLAPYIKAFYDGMVTLNTKIGTTDTTDTLLYGIYKVNDGLEQLGAGLPAAPEAIASQLIPGIDQLSSAVNTMIPGVQTAVAGIGSPTTNPSLMYADAQVTAGLQGISAGIGSPTAADTLLYAMAAMNAGLEQTKAGIGSATTDDTLLFAMNAIEGGLSGIAAGIGAASTPNTLLYAVASVQGGLNSILGGVGAILTGLGNAAQPTTIIGGLTQILGGLQGMSVGLGAAGQPGTIIDGLTTMMNNINPTTGPLYGAINTVYSGLLLGGGGLTDAINGLYAAYAIPPADAIRTQIDGTILPGYQGALSPTTGALAGLAQMYGGLNTQIIPGLTNIKNGMDVQMIPGLTNILAGLNGSVVPGLQGIAAGIGSAATPGTLLYAMAAIQAGLSGIQAGIGNSSTAGTLLYGATAVQGGLLQIAAGIGDPAAAGTLLYAVQAVESGLDQMKAGIGDAGVSDTMLYAMAAIQGGLAALKAGLSSGDPNDPALLEGLVLVSGGLSQVTGGLGEMEAALTKAAAGVGSASTPDTLLYGSNAILSGTTQLKEEGTMKLEEGLLAVMTNFSMTNAELEAIAERGEEFDHFLGRAQDAENNVRFVYQSKPTYNYTEGSSTSWIVAIVLSILIALGLVAGGILLARRSTA